MKSLILSAAIILSLTANAAFPAEPVTEKALKTFGQIFKGAQNVSWANLGSNYEAFFTTGSIKTRAMLDRTGELVQTIRYYDESELPANVLYNIKKEYRGKEVYGITEVSNKYGVNYRVVLRDDKQIFHINANSTGDTELVSKYKRGDK